MKEKIFSLLDELVLLGNTTYTTESLEIEIEEINKKISKAYQKINRLNDIINDTRYFDASSQMIDKNIEISLAKKINVIKNNLDKINDEITINLQEENNLQTQITKFNKRIEDINKLIDTIKKKIADGNIKSVEDYEKLLEEYLNRKEEYSKSNEELYEQKREVSIVLNNLSNERDTLEEKLNKEIERLSDVRDDLSNENNYFDIQAKQDDDNKLNAVKEEIELLEEKKKVLLADVANYASEAKKFIKDEKWDLASDKINQLINNIKNVPYIDENDHDVLKEKYDQLFDEINKKKFQIDNKDYKTKDYECLSDRIDYLNYISEILQNKLIVVEDLEKFIDNELVNDSKKSVGEIEVKREKLVKDINDVNVTSSGINSIDFTAAKYLYKKELDNVDNIISKSNNDIEYLINLSSILEASIINPIKEKISSNEKEVSELEKELSLKTKTIDIKAKKEDYDELAQMNKELSLLKNSLDKERTLDEINNELQCLLASIDFEEPVKRRRKRKKLIEEEPEEELVLTDVLETQNDDSVLFDLSENIIDSIDDTDDKNELENIDDEIVDEEITDAENTVLEDSTEELNVDSAELPEEEMRIFDESMLPEADYEEPVFDDVSFDSNEIVEDPLLEDENKSVLSDNDEISFDLNIDNNDTVLSSDDDNNESEEKYNEISLEEEDNNKFDFDSILNEIDSHNELNKFESINIPSIDEETEVSSDVQNEITENIFDDSLKTEFDNVDLSHDEVNDNDKETDLEDVEINFADLSFDNLDKNDEERIKIVKIIPVNDAE